MAMNIQPGQWVNVKVKTEPRTAAGRKTLIRLFRKDPQVKLEHNRLARSRPTRWVQRGGRPWGNRPPILQVARTSPGSSYRIFASVDVVRDLRSVESDIEVTPTS
jgi:hypothetical protein